MDRVSQQARGDRGQVLPLVAVMVVLIAGAALLIAQVGGLVDERARARTAADAAALAGAAEGRDAAVELASANGATLERFEVRGSDTYVEVRVGRARAAAQATTEVRGPRPG